MEITTIDGWQKIASIEFVGYKQVYDLSIEDTHNFVVNGIIAHNTYIGGALTQAGDITINKADLSVIFDVATAADTDFWLTSREY